MKKLIVTLISLVFLFSASISFAGRFDSNYDLRWTIEVRDCQGTTTIYHGCALTNQGEGVVSFIPDAGRISGFQGKKIQIVSNECTSIVMQEE